MTLVLVRDMLVAMRWWVSVVGAILFASSASALGQSTGRFPDAPPTSPTAPVPPTAPAPTAPAPVAPTPAPVAPAPVAPAPVAPAPVAPAPVAPAPYWPAPVGVEPPRQPTPQVKREGFVFVPRFGVRLYGGGEIGGECEGDCAGFETEQFDYDDSSTFGFGLDVLFAVIPELRLGVGAFWVPDTEIEIDGASQEAELGSDLTVPFIVEGVFDAAPRMSIALRAFVGLWILFPDGDLDDAIESQQRECDFAPPLASCEIDDGPYVGPTFGLGPGLVFPLRDVSLRVDLYYQWYSAKILQTKLGFEGQSVETNNDLTGSRVLLTGGVEF